MELWRMDVVGGVRLVDGSEAKIVSGIDDHSRFVVSAPVVGRATAGPVCEALQLAVDRYGPPASILTDNGKVFTARFGPGPGPVRFDRICTDHGIRHLLTAPRSPTTTGKVERWHKTLRAEFLTGKTFASVPDAQAQLDAWVERFNHERPHQSIGRVPPHERFHLAAPAPAATPPGRPTPTAASVTRKVDSSGNVSFAGASDRAGNADKRRRVQVNSGGRRHRTEIIWPGPGNRRARTAFGVQACRRAGGTRSDVHGVTSWTAPVTGSSFRV